HRASTPSARPVSPGALLGDPDGAIHVYFVVTVLPPQSTLFPYTTLFRSTYEMWVRGGADRRFLMGSSNFSINELDQTHLQVMGEDRKSTGLNTSHAISEYAGHLMNVTYDGTTVAAFLDGQFMSSAKLGVT